MSRNRRTRPQPLFPQEVVDNHQDYCHYFSQLTVADITSRSPRFIQIIQHPHFYYHALYNVHYPRRVEKDPYHFDPSEHPGRVRLFGGQHASNNTRAREGRQRRLETVRAKANMERAACETNRNTLLDLQAEEWVLVNRITEDRTMEAAEARQRLEIARVAEAQRIATDELRQLRLRVRIPSTLTSAANSTARLLSTPAHPATHLSDALRNLRIEENDDSIDLCHTDNESDGKFDSGSDVDPRTGHIRDLVEEDKE